MNKLQLTSYETKKELVENYQFEVGRNEEPGKCWFVTPLESQIAEFKNGLGKINYFITRELNQYDLITDYVLIGELLHDHDCSCGKCNENTRANLFKLDSFEDCYLGIGEAYGEQPRLVYDYKKIIEALEKTGMSEEEAREFYDFNIIGSYLGEKMPIFLITDISLEDLNIT